MRSSSRLHRDSNIKDHCLLIDHYPLPYDAEEVGSRGRNHVVDQKEVVQEYVQALIQRENRSEKEHAAIQKDEDPTATLDYETEDRNISRASTERKSGIKISSVLWLYRL